MSLVESETPVLPVGDARRPPVLQALVSVMIASLTFVTFALMTTQAEGLRTHSPWQDDPYDVVVSFTMFFVPMLLGISLVRGLVCRRSDPLPIQRVRAMLRAMWLTVLLIALTLVVDWISVAVGAHRTSWTWETAALMGFLLFTTLISVVAAISVRAASSPPILRGSFDRRAPPDWAADAIAVAERTVGSLPFFRSIARRATDSLPTMVDGQWGLRRHPLLWAAAVCLAFGLLLATGAALEEGVSPVLGLFIGVGACAMFAFLVIGGWCLGIVRSTQPWSGVRRRLVDAFTLACASVPMALGLRDSLWWLVRSSTATARLATLWLLVIAIGGAVFVTVLVGETLLRLHRVD